MADKQYREAFEDELRMFKDRVCKRAQAKVQKAMEEAEEVPWLYVITSVGGGA